MLLVWLLPLALLVALGGSVIAIGAWLNMRKLSNDPETRGGGSGCVIAGCAWAPFTLLAGLLFAAPLLTGIRPASADFEEGLGIPAGPEITNLRGKTEVGFDARVIYLAFDNTPKARDTVTGRFAAASQVAQTDRLDSDIFTGNSPSWFKAGAVGFGDKGCSNRQVNEFHRALGWDDAIVVVCSSDQRIYMLFSSID